ncbi:MAG: DUF4382 domain-containing protein [Bacteroidota bacterium]
MKKVNLILCTIMLGVAMMMNACKKDSKEASYPYAMRMTDAPGDYDAVYVDIIGVEVTGGDGKAVLLNVNPGIYNLLDFSNGKDTLIASSTLGVSTVSQIRLILGPNNSIVVDSVTYPLSTPSAEQSGLKLQVHQQLQDGVLYTVLLDFDANKSIVETGNNTYKLKPVIRTIEKAISGSISGNITPAVPYAAVTAVSASSETYTTVTNKDGYFVLGGLPAGTYAVTINPAAPLNDKTINSVVVTIGATTSLGSIQL